MKGEAEIGNRVRDEFGREEHRGCSVAANGCGGGTGDMKRRIVSGGQ